MLISSPRRVYIDFTPPRTLDGGIAQFGFLKAVKSYVMRDDSFGLIGCGCRVESSGKEIRVYPRDGLKKRLRFVPQKIDLEAAQGEVDQITISDDARWLGAQPERLDCSREKG